jgi:hypothetical protein
MKLKLSYRLKDVELALSCQSFELLFTRPLQSAKDAICTRCISSQRPLWSSLLQGKQARNHGPMHWSVFLSFSAVHIDERSMDAF